jgi:hypothetical protein
LLIPLADPSPENQSAVDCLRRALKNLRELLNTVNDKYASSVKYVMTSCLAFSLPSNFLSAFPLPLCLAHFVTRPSAGRVHSIRGVAEQC